MGRLLFYWVPLIFYTSLFADFSLEELSKKCHVPGIAVAQIEKDKIAYSFHGIAKKKAVDKTTVFQAASLSKPFFSAAFIDWVETEKISLNTPIIKFIPSIQNLFSDGDFSQITLKQLLSHQSGLQSINYPGYLTEEECPTLLYSLMGIEGSHSRLSFTSQSGAFVYSGAGYTILQLIAENISGKDFDTFMFDHLFRKMKLKDCTFNFSNVDQEKLAFPHDIFGKTCELRFFSEKAAAGLYSNVQDLALFIKELMKKKNQDILETMLNNFKDNYGLGLELESIGNNCCLAYHFGANRGWRSGFFFVPELEVGLVVLTNSDNGYACICSLVESWIKELGLRTPYFIKKERLNHRVTFWLSVFFWVLFIFRLSLLWFLLVYNRRRFFLSTKRLCGCFVLMLIFAFWIIIFFTPYFPPKNWIAAAFMPQGFLCLSMGVLLFIIEESVSLLFKKFSENSFVTMLK